MTPADDIRPEVHRFRESSSVIVAGMWRLTEKLDPAGIREFISACLEAGINTFDHADIYGAGECERQFGIALRRLKVARDKVVIISKCGNIMPLSGGGRFDAKRYDTSKEHILKSVDGTLDRLDTDYLDMLLLHRYNPMADYAQISAAFDELKAMGKVRSFGVSNYPPLQFDYLNRYLGDILVSNQFECSVFNPAPMFDGTIDCLQSRGLIPMAWSPLGGNLPQRLSTNGELQVVMAEAGRLLGIGENLAAVALCWLMSHPAGIVPVIGAASIPHLRDATRSIGINMPREVFFSILSAAIKHELP